jgi:hypothetical protein
VKKAKSAPSIKDAQAADLSNGTYVILDSNDSDAEHELHRVMASTPNGVIFARISNWHSEEKIFRYRHAIQEMKILEMTYVHTFVFHSFRDWPNGKAARSTYDEVAPSEAAIARFIQLWGQPAFRDYLGWVRRFSLENEDGFDSKSFILADILHFLPFVPAADDRADLAEHARHKIVRSLFQTTLTKQKTA